MGKVGSGLEGLPIPPMTRSCRQGGSRLKRSPRSARASTPKVYLLYYTLGEGNGTPLQYSCLENPWMEEPGGLQSMGSLRVRHDWATSLSPFTFMHWRRKWQPTPVFLPGESQGQGKPGGLPSMRSHRVGHDWSDLAAAAYYTLLTLTGAIPNHLSLEN